MRPLFGLRETPTFRIEVQERNRLQDLVASLDFRSGPVPAGGSTRLRCSASCSRRCRTRFVSRYAAFNQPELLTILIQTIAGTYLAGRAASAITNAEQAAAEEAARQELRRTIVVSAPPSRTNGAGIEICTAPPP